jgi:O-antigen/teichoic acid export membrane protein
MFLVTMYARARGVVRFRPHDTSTEHGRSHERYRRMALTSAASLGARGVGLLASLISIPLTFRYLGAERYGLWMVLTSLISAMAFADLGIGNGVINLVAEAYGKDDRALAREYVTSAFALLLGIAAVLAVAGAATYPFIPWSRLFNVNSTAVASEGARAFLVLFYWFIVSLPLGVVTRAQAGLQQAYWSQVIGASGNIASLLALMLVISLHASLTWLVFASTFGAIVATLVNGWLLFREHPWLFPTWHAFRGSSANKIFKIGLMFLVLQCAFAVSYSSDNIVIAQVLGAVAVAMYAVPQKLFSFVSILVGMGVAPLWPAYGEAIARGDVTWVRRAFLRSLWLTLAIAVPLCALLALAAPWILRVAMGKALQAPMSLLIVLAIWGVVNSVSVVVAMLLNGAGGLKSQTFLVVVVSICNLALSVLLTQRVGVMGVCLGSIIAQLLIAFPAYAVLVPRLFANMASGNPESGRPGGASLT